MTSDLRPMSEFDPARACVVHDRLNDKTFDWKPEWAENFREHAIFDTDGTVVGTGLSWMAGVDERGRQLRQPSH